MGYKTKRKQKNEAHFDRLKDKSLISLAIKREDLFCSI